jgi:transcriptional regulator with XRE-family HTH domain
MKLSDKIVRLRKSNGWSQEDLAEKLNVSRQAISRWEGSTAQPDAANILQLSKLFGVTTDYLLNDEYESDNDLPKIKEVKNDSFHQILILVITLEVMILIIQFMTTIILQNTFFSVLSFIPFVASIGGFEYAYQKKKNEANETTNVFRKKFYKISAWLGAYFPIRFVITSLSHFYPRPYNMIILECVIFVIYLIMATLLCFQIEKNSLKGK